MLWKRTMNRIKLRLEATAAFRTAAMRVRLRRRRSSILANLHSSDRNGSRVSFSPFRDSIAEYDIGISIASDRWHRAITQVVVQNKVIRAFKDGIKPHPEFHTLAIGSPSSSNRVQVQLTL